jgi:hypothetical protein
VYFLREQLLLYCCLMQLEPVCDCNHGSERLVDSFEAGLQPLDYKELKHDLKYEAIKHDLHVQLMIEHCLLCLQGSRSNA